MATKKEKFAQLAARERRKAREKQEEERKKKREKEKAERFQGYSVRPSTLAALNFSEKAAASESSAIASKLESPSSLTSVSRPANGNSKWSKVNGAQERTASPSKSTSKTSHDPKSPIQKIIKQTKETKTLSKDNYKRWIDKIEPPDTPTRHNKTYTPKPPQTKEKKRSVVDDRKPKAFDPDDSSEESDIDLMAVWEMSKQEKKRERSTARDSDYDQKRAARMDRTSRHDDDDGSDSAPSRPQKRNRGINKSHQLKENRQASVLPPTDSDSLMETSSSEREADHRSRKKIILQKKRPHNTHIRRKKQSSSPLEEENNDGMLPSNKLMSTIGNDDPSDKEDVKPRKVVWNPLTIEKEQRERAAAAAISRALGTLSYQQDEDDLWSDDGWGDNKLEDDGNQNTKNSKQQTTPSKKRRKPSSNPSPSGRDSYGLSFERDGDWWLSIDDDDIKYTIKQLIKRHDEEGLKLQLKPEFENPIFEPSALEPFVLGEGSARVHQVPATLARYLAPYQKEGIKFMHKCLCSNSGTIMGDDMGLGKTVQVIALLSALFEKTGTGLDLLEIKRRNDLIQERIALADEEKDRAILEGNFVEPKTLDTSYLNMPSWFPVLIVVPPSVVDNWKLEFKKFSNFAVATYAGASVERERDLQKLCQGRAEVLVASHSMFQGKTSFKDLEPVPWKLVIVDEFHKLKNPKGHLSVNLRNLKLNHNCLVLGMTGTLMSNNHQELWNLIDLAETDLIGKWGEFKEDTAKAIKLGRQKNADQTAIERGERKALALNKKLSMVLIERTKDEVVKDFLPKKTETFLLCELSDFQKQIYAQILSLPDVELMRLGSCPCDCGKNEAFFKKYLKIQSASDRVRYCREKKNQIVKRCECCHQVPLNPRRKKPDDPLIDPDAVLWRFIESHDEETGTGCERCPYCVTFPILAKLNKLCSHAASIQALHASGSNQPGTSEFARFTKELQFAQVAIPPKVVDGLPGGYIRKPNVLDDHFVLSGKIKALHKLLKTFRREGSQVLIFSFSTQTLDLIQNYVKQQSYKFERIDGSVKPKDRQGICDKFNNDPSIFLFLLSTKATGLGLNLVAASKVIIFDVEWNPSWDQQAQDRAFRLGQKRDVQVIRLIARGTIDELKYFRQIYKLHLKKDTLETNGNAESRAKAPRLFRAVQGDSSRKGELFGIENLLKFKPDGSFFDGIWKSKDTKGRRKKTNDVEILEAPDLAANGLVMQRCEEILDADVTAEFLHAQADHDTESRWISKVPAQGVAQVANNGIKCKNEKDTDSDSESMQDGFQGKSINHRDLLQEDKGVAANEDSEEEGAHTQNVAAAFEGILWNKSRNNQNEEREEDAEEVIANDVRSAEESGDESDIDLQNEGVNHGDLFNEEAGDAASEDEEEWGAETQNAFGGFEDTNMPLAENPQDASMDDEIDHSHLDINNDVPILQNDGRNETAENGLQLQVSNRQESNNRQEISDRASFFSSRQARKNISSDAFVAREATTQTAEARAVVKETEVEDTATRLALSVYSSSSTERQAIALVGMSASEIAERGDSTKLDFQLPTYKKKLKKRKK